MIRVFIVEDHPVMRQSLRTLLSRQDDLNVCGEAHNGEEAIRQIREIQDRLFTVGSSLATDPHKDTKMRLPDLKEEDVLYLENAIDTMEESLPPLKSFILPGGDTGAAFAHVARCVCRRAERICVHMVNTNEFVAEIVLRYLNRLSDYLFVLGRYMLHQAGGRDLEWKSRIQD